MNIKLFNEYYNITKDNLFISLTNEEVDEKNKLSLNEFKLTKKLKQYLDNLTDYEVKHMNISECVLISNKITDRIVIKSLPDDYYIIEQRLRKEKKVFYYDYLCDTDDGVIQCIDKINLNY